MSDEVKETIIEFESVKKGRKAIFFVLIGLFVATTVAFMLLWILKPAGSSVGVQSITITSDIKKSGVDDGGNDIYLASVGGKYSVSADVSVIGEVDAKSAVEWSVFPSDCVSAQTTGVDPENPNRSIMSFTVSPNAITSDGSDREITVRASSPFGKGVVAEFKFKARASYAAEGKIESVKFGDRGFAVSQKDSQHYAVEIPYFSTSKDPDMFTYTVNVAQFAAKAENGEYMELTRGIAGLEGKQIDNIKYSMEDGGAAEIPYTMNGESVIVRLNKAGKATLKATLNAYNNGADLPVFLEITAKDITEYKDVLSSIKFKRNEYTLFLHENRQEDLFDLQEEIIFSQDPPAGREWSYQVYESDISGNAVASANRKLTVNRSVDGKIMMGPVQGGAAGNTYVTVRDDSPAGYGVFHTVPVRVRNPVYSEKGDALSVTQDGKTEFSEYQGETVDINVTYKLREYDGKLTSDNLTTELYFYYADPADAPGTSNFSSANGFVTFVGMLYKGELGTDRRTHIYSVSPSAVKISDDGKTATATLKMKIGGVTPDGRVGVTFVTFPQTSHKDPNVLENAILGESDGVYISSELLNVDVLKTVTAINVKQELGDLLSDGSRFFRWSGDKANEYRLVRPAGITSVSPYSILDLFDYKGSLDTKVEFGTNLPKNLDITIDDGAKDVLQTGYRLAGSASETNDPAIITVTLNKGKKDETIFRIKLYYRVTIKEAALPDETPIHSAYQLDASAYKNGDTYGLVTTQYGGIGNFPRVVQFYDHSGQFANPDDKYVPSNENNGHNKWKKNWNIERNIFIGREMLVKVPAGNVMEGNKTLVAYFYLSDQIKSGVTPDAREALYKMDADGYIYVNRDLFAYMRNNTDVKCDSIYVVYSAYEIKADGGGFILDGGEFYGTERYEDYDAFIKCGLAAARNYVAHRGFDAVDFFDKDYSEPLDGTLDVNVGSTFTLYPSGIISYYDNAQKKVVDLVVEKAGLGESFHIGSLKITNNDTNKIENIDDKKYQYNVKNKQDDPIADAFTMSAVYTQGRIDASKDKKISLNVLDMYLPVDSIEMYMSESDATGQYNKVQNNTVMQLARGDGGRNKITVWYRIGYVSNTSYTYLSGLLFRLVGTGSIDQGGVTGEFEFGGIRATINGNPHDGNRIEAGNKTHYIFSVDFELISDNSENGKFDIEVTPLIDSGNMPNQTAKIDFSLDFTSYADGVALSSTDTDDNFAFDKKADGSGNYSADINLTQNGGALDASETVTINALPFVSSGTADARHIAITVSNASGNDEYFTVTTDGNAISLTPKNKTCVNKSFTVSLTETRYVLKSSVWTEETEVKTTTVFVNITADIYAVSFDKPTGEIAVNVSGGTGTARAEFAASFNEADTRNTKDELEFVLSDDKDGKIRIDGNAIVVDNDINFAGTVTLTARSKKNNTVKAEKTVRITSLDKALTFANFVNGGGNGYTAEYTSDGASVNIIYFGSNSMDFALSGVSGENYDVSYSITSGTASINDGLVTWSGDGVKRFTVRASVTFKSSGGATREKTLTANVVANGRAAAIDGLTGIAGYDAGEIVAYEGVEIDLSGLSVKASDGGDASALGYTVTKDGTDAANDKITVTNNKLTVSALDDGDDGTYAHIRITAKGHEKDTAQQYYISVAVKLVKLSAEDKNAVLKKDGAIVTGDTINAATLSSGDTFTAEFESNIVIEKLVGVYGAKAEYTLRSVNGAATINGNTITVNSVKSGSFTVKAIVKIGDRVLFESEFTKRVENASEIVVKYGTSDVLTDAKESGALDIGYNGLAGDTEKFVYAFVDYSALGIDLSGVADADINKYFTPYASGQKVVLQSTTHDKTSKVFVVKYKVSPTAYTASGLSANFGKLYLGGTIRSGGFDYNAPNAEFDITASVPNITLLGGNNNAPLEPTIKGGAENEREFATQIAGYTLGDSGNYTIVYELLSDGDFISGNYNAPDNILSLSASGNTATFTAKSYVGDDGAIISYAKNSVKLRVKVTITKGIYAGFATEKIITVSVNEKVAPTFSLKTDIDKYNAEFGGIVLDKITDNADAEFEVLTGTGVAGQYKLSNAFTASIETYIAGVSGLDASVWNAGVYSSPVAGKQEITVDITVNDGYFKEAKMPLTFNVFVLPSVKIDNKYDIDTEKTVTAGKTVSVTATADEIDGAKPVITFTSNGSAGYISSVTQTGNTATAVIEPNTNASGEIIVSAYATYASGSYKGRTVSAKANAIISVLSARLDDIAANADGNKISGNRVYIMPRTSFELPNATALGKNASGSANTTFELVGGAYEAGKISLSGKTLSAAIDANTAQSGNVTYNGALKITITDGSTTFVGFADIIVMPRELDAKPTGITVTGTGADYTLSVGGVIKSVSYTAEIKEGASAITETTLTIGDDGILRFTPKVVKADTPIVILVTATVETECYGTLVFTEYIYETIKAQIDALPVLDITYSDGDKMFAVGVAGAAADIDEIKLSGSADGFTLGAGNNGVFGYTLIANENASVTLTAYATLTSGDHRGKIITVTKTFDGVVPTQARVEPTFDVSGALSGLNGSFALNVTGAENPTYEYEILAGGSALAGAEKVVISGDSLTFTALAQKQDTPIKIRVSATVTVAYYGTVTLYDDIEVSVSGTPAPTLKVTSNANHTVTVGINTTESGVTLENIELILANADGLTVTKTATGVTYTFVSNDESKSVAYAAKAIVKGGVYNGETITLSGSVTITRTDVPKVPDELPELTIGLDETKKEITVSSTVGLANITLISSNENLVLTDKGSGVFGYEFTADGTDPISVHFGAFATVSQAGNDFDGKQIGGNAIFAVKPTKAPEKPDPVPTLDVKTEIDTAANTVTVTVSTAGDAKVALKDIIITGISGGNGTYDDATKTYTYVCEYDPAVGLEAATVTVFATVGEGEHAERVIKGTAEIEKIESVTVTPTDPEESGESEKPEITE